MTGNEKISEKTIQVIEAFCAQIIQSITLNEGLAQLNFIKFDDLMDATQARNRYCKIILLNFGFLNKHLHDLGDDEAMYAMQVSVHILNSILRKDEQKKYFHGLDLNEGGSGGFSKFNAEVCEWCSNNGNSTVAKKISITGSHLFYKLASGENPDSLMEDRFINEGSLLEKNKNGVDVIKKIFDNKIITNF